MSAYYDEMKQRAEDLYTEGYELHKGTPERARFHREALARIDQPDRGVIKQYLDRRKSIEAAKRRKKNTYEFSKWHPENRA